MANLDKLLVNFVLPLVPPVRLLQDYKILKKQRLWREILNLIHTKEFLNFQKENTAEETLKFQKKALWLCII